MILTKRFFNAASCLFLYVRVFFVSSLLMINDQWLMIDDQLGILSYNPLHDKRNMIPLLLLYWKKKKSFFFVIPDQARFYFVLVVVFLIKIKYSFWVLQKNHLCNHHAVFAQKIDTVLTCATARLSSLELYSTSI